MIGVGGVLRRGGAGWVRGGEVFSNGTIGGGGPACASLVPRCAAPRSAKIETVGSFGMETGREARESSGMDAAFLSVVQPAF